MRVKSTLLQWKLAHGILASRGIEVEHESRKLMSECFADGNLKNSFSISNDANLTAEMEFANISNRLI
jgi:hypothetical protein